MTAGTPEQMAAKAAELLKAAERVDRAFIALRRALKWRARKAAELRALGYAKPPLPAEREVTRTAYHHRLSPLLRLECMSQRRVRSMVAEDTFALSFLPKPAPSITPSSAEPAGAGLPEAAA